MHNQRSRGIGAGRLGCGEGSTGPVPIKRRRTTRAQMEPSRRGSANACRVVRRAPPHTRAGPRQPPTACVSLGAMSVPDVDADAIEELYARGVTDGLRAVPPTRARVDRAIAASGRSGDELVALVPPNYGSATVEKVAINAVMAGCRPEYLPVVIAAIDAVCDEAFDLHGVSATTNAPSPLVIVNGPIRARLEINSGAGVFGPGWRANATIGRAVRLVCVNLGGARPGVVSMSTLAHPGRYTYCIGEHEEASPWESLAVEHGFAASQSVVAVLAADAPLGVYAQHSRTPDHLLPTLAASMAVVSHHRMTHWGDTLLVLSPEHAKIFGDAGWKKADVRRWLHERLRWPVRVLRPGLDGGEGLPEHVLAKFGDPSSDTTMIPKFRSPENIKVLVAGGLAGRFSAIVPGWTVSKGSALVFSPLQTPSHCR